MRPYLVPVSIPLLGLAFAVWGQFHEKASILALAFAGMVALWGAGLFVLGAVQIARKARFLPLVAGFGLACVSIGASVAIAVGTPVWVQRRAEPAIAALEQEKAEKGHYPRVDSLEGDFPRPIKATLDASGHCVYRPRGDDYHLACVSIPYSKCGYDSATRAWSGWE